MTTTTLPQLAAQLSTVSAQISAMVGPTQPGPLAKLVPTPDHVSLLPGQQVSVTVTGYDAAGNVVP